MTSHSRLQLHEFYKFLRKYKISVRFATYLFFLFLYQLWNIVLCATYLYILFIRREEKQTPTFAALSFKRENVYNMQIICWSSLACWFSYQFALSIFPWSRFAVLRWSGYMFHNNKGHNVRSSVSDIDSLDPDPDPGILLNRDSIRIWIQTKFYFKEIF